VVVVLIQSKLVTSIVIFRQQITRSPQAKVRSIDSYVGHLSFYCLVGFNRFCGLISVLIVQNRYPASCFVLLLTLLDIALSPLIANWRHLPVVLGLPLVLLMEPKTKK
jgi:hypothetical protein